MAHKIIQWNCRGLRSHYNDLAILLQEHSPTAVCLQETNLKPNTNISFKNYSLNNCFGPANNERACWGVSILVKDGTPHQQITLNTTLQVSHQIQTGLWLYCLWFSETIVLSST